MPLAASECCDIAHIGLALHLASERAGTEAIAWSGSKKREQFIGGSREGSGSAASAAALPLRCQFMTAKRRR